MEVRNAANPTDVKNYTTDRLRKEFHIPKLFEKDEIKMVYSHIDRIITAGFMPVEQELKLEARTCSKLFFGKKRNGLYQYWW